MILLNISSQNEDTIKLVAQILLKENWAADVNLKKNVKRLTINKNDSIEESSIYILTAKTKALLFSKIENRLQELLKEIKIELYAIPITAMELKQSDELINLTQKV